MRTLVRLPGGAAAPLLHWLVLIGGLALLSVGEIVDQDSLLPTWLGAIFGTGGGQLLARLRFRVWSATLLTLCLTLVWAVCAWNLRGPGCALEAFVPAVICGYLSLTARGALAGFWFPAVPWSLAIIEADASPIVGGASGLGPSWVLWILLGGLLLAALWARETRRVVQWRSDAIVDLAPPAERVVLREAPMRAQSRLAWGVALGGATIALAAWIAPELRQWDPAAYDVTRRAAAATASRHPLPVALDGAGRLSRACCPEAPVAPARARRVKEYISPRRHEVDAPPPPTSCVACEDGVPIGGPPSASDAVYASGGPMTPAGEPAAAGAAPLTPPTALTTVTAAQAPAPATSVAVVTPPRAPAPAPTTVARAVNAPVEPPPSTHGAASPRAPSSRVASKSAPPFEPVREVKASEHPVLRGLLALLVAALVVSVPLRPLRRWLVLRHLRRPLWRETVGQRVSNLWQLALIGLRDAGWHPDVGESPAELARRVGIEGVRVCAEVLERARHGVRVDAADLAAMERAAQDAFGAARERAGSIARFASWWRAPSG